MSATTSLLVSKELADSARTRAKENGCTLAQQIESWAWLGKLVEMQLRDLAQTRFVVQASKPSVVPFLRDFQCFEKEIAAGVSCPVERMIVELRLTPRRAAQIQRRLNVSFHWVAPAYAVMKKHGLLPMTNSWSDWLTRYCAKKCQVLLKWG